MRRISLVLFSSFFALSAAAQPITLQDLRSKISSARRGWIAGDTKVSTLSLEDQKRLLGANIPTHGDFFFTPASTRKAFYGPAAHDWRNVSGTKFSSPILDQGRCGSCVAFAAIGQLETQMNISRNTTHSPWSYSPQHLFSCGGGACETGWMPMQALSFLQNTGVPDEACFPYTSGARGEDVACSNSCSNAKDRMLKISGYKTESFFFGFFSDGLKKALQKGPLLATMTVYEDFMFYKSGIYKYTSGKQLGGHAVVIEGYSDADKAWIVRNNWGEDWGEKGFFRVAYNDQSGIGNNAWSIEVPTAEGSVTLGSLRDHEVLSGAAQTVQLDSTFSDTQRIRWELSQAGVSKLDGFVARSSSTTLDTTKVPDGIYQIAPIAERASGIVRGQPRNIYVLNGTHTASVAFSNVKGGDTLTGKKVLELDLTYSPIPFNKLIFRAINTTTGKVVERSTPNIANKMNLSFQTENAGNGDWDLSLEGLAGTQSTKSAAVRVTIKN